MSGRALAERRGDIRRVRSSAVGGARSSFVGLRSAPARLERHRLARSRRSPGNRVRCAASQRACRHSRRRSNTRCCRPLPSSIGSCCSTRSRSSTHRRGRRCGRTKKPSSARFSSWISASVVALGICRGSSTSIQPRTAAQLEATRSLCSTDGDVVTLPATELLIRRISPRRSASARPGVGHDCVEHRAAQIRPNRQLPRAAVRQRTGARAAGAARTGDHGVLEVDEDVSLLYRPTGCRRHVARLLGRRSTQRRPTSVPMWRIRRLGGASIVVHFE